ncbi:MAG: Response regulator receiver modulated metal dependent phosphohydrolase [uncultured bacterium]|nr:MAG: Response regulator receiver modulated metal dependent phosphohydrolase [uncultured bacterium]
MSSISPIQTTTGRTKVLVVDDNPTNVELISVQLKPFNYELRKAYDGEQALEMVRQEAPDLILLDLMMPRLSGYEVCRILKNDPATQLIPIIIVTALKELDDKLKAIELGADDFLMKPYNKLELVTRVKSLLRVKLLYDALDSCESVVFTLAEALEAKDVYTRGHSERVSKYSVMLGEFLKLTGEEIKELHRGSLLHDIGKVGIKETILNKESKLTSEEIAHIRSHPARGYEICKGLKSFKNLLPIIRNHHERWDGKGHPDGIAGLEITLGARICSITDAYDAMTSNRPYRKGINPLQAADIFEREQMSGQWDPELLVQFVKLIRSAT